MFAGPFLTLTRQVHSFIQITLTVCFLLDLGASILTSAGARIWASIPIPSRYIIRTILVEDNNQHAAVYDDMGRCPAFGQSVWFRLYTHNGRGNASTHWSTGNRSPPTVLLPATCKAADRYQFHGSRFVHIHLFVF